MWAHPVYLNDTACLVLLLAHKLPDELLQQDFQVGNVGPKPCPDDQRCRLGRPTRQMVDAAQRELLVRWQVGTFDLVRAGSEGEPLHPLLGGLRQLLKYSTQVPLARTYAPEEQRAADAATSSGGDAATTSASGHEARMSVDDLTAKISKIAGGGAEAEVVAVFDLDKTCSANVESQASCEPEGAVA